MKAQPKRNRMRAKCCEAMIGGGKIFVNCTRNCLVEGLVTLLPVATTVLEVLETVQVDCEVGWAAQQIGRVGG